MVEELYFLFLSNLSHNAFNLGRNLILRRFYPLSSPKITISEKKVNLRTVLYINSFLYCFMFSYAFYFVYI